MTLSCGLPATARSISGNVTVTGADDIGYVVLFAGDAAPWTTTVNYRPGQTRANSFVIGITPTGSLSVGCGQWTGHAHVIVDVNGYFE